MSLDLTDYQSTLVQVMALGLQATGHYLSQCWLRYMASLGHNELRSCFVSTFKTGHQDSSPSCGHQSNILCLSLPEYFMCSVYVILSIVLCSVNIFLWINMISFYLHVNFVSLCKGNEVQIICKLIIGFGKTSAPHCQSRFCIICNFSYDLENSRSRSYMHFFLQESTHPSYSSQKSFISLNFIKQTHHIIRPWGFKLWPENCKDTNIRHDL